MSKFLLTNARLYAASEIITPGWLLVDNGRVAAMGAGVAPEIADALLLDLAGQRLIPGLIDLHTHGALGYDTMDATPEALRAMAGFYARHGVTSFLASTMTAPAEAIDAALENIAAVMCAGTGGANLLGAHVEGPYIDAARRGAQRAEDVRPASLAEYRRLCESGVVRLLTVAPEYVENRALIPFAVSHGAIVALGHSRASYEEACHALDLGASQVTHLFNAMEPLHHRQPGLVGAALALDEFYVELIADNIHIHPAVLRLAVRAKGVERVLLVTDAMRGTGMPDGSYDLGGQSVTVHNGEARLGNGALAGSTLTLERGVRHIMAAADLSLEQALRMASANPARQLGLEERKGLLAVGADADLVALDDELNVVLTLVDGRLVYQRPA